MIIITIIIEMQYKVYIITWQLRSIGNGWPRLLHN